MDGSLSPTPLLNIYLFSCLPLVPAWCFPHGWHREALNEKSRQNLEDQRKADQLLQDSLYEHNQKQRVLRLWGRNLTQVRAALTYMDSNTPSECRKKFVCSRVKSQQHSCTGDAKIVPLWFNSQHLRALRYCDIFPSTETRAQFRRFRKYPRHGMRCIS